VRRLRLRPTAGPSRVAARTRAAASEALARGRRLRGPRRVAALGALGVVLLALVATLASALFGGGGQTSSAATTATATTEVRRTDLVEYDSEQGKLGYGDSKSVVNRLSGTVTWLPAEGDVIRQDHTLFRVDGSQVILLDGDVPAYRTLQSGVSDGADVQQLERDLRALGYDDGNAMTIDDEWDSATTAAVERWQDKHGFDQTGSIELGRVVFQSGTRRVASLEATLGGDGSGGGASSSGTSSNGSSSSGSSSSGTSSGAASSGSSGSADSASAGRLASTQAGVGTLRFASVTTTPQSGDQQTAEEKKAEEKKAEKEKKAREKAAREKAAREKAAREKAAREKKAKQKAEAEKKKQAATEQPSAQQQAPSGTAGATAGAAATGGGSSAAAGSSGSGAATSGSDGGATSASTEVLTTTSTHPEVTVDLDTSKQELAKKASKVSLELPSGGTTTGVVRSVGTVAKSSSSDSQSSGGTTSSSSSSSSDATVTVTIWLSSRSTGLDQAPVTVKFQSSKRKDVLAIPVTALLARSGGTYAVEVRDGSQRRLLKVEPGLYTSGDVEISGSGLREGMKVTDARV
jgi:Putative peptidoglycan binding domain